MTVPLPTTDGRQTPADAILDQAVALLDQPIDVVIATVVAAVMAYGVRTGMTPREVAEVLFQQMPSDEDWSDWSEFVARGRGGG